MSYYIAVHKTTTCLGGKEEISTYMVADNLPQRVNIPYMYMYMQWDYISLKNRPTYMYIHCKSHAKSPTAHKIKAGSSIPHQL